MNHEPNSRSDIRARSGSDSAVKKAAADWTSRRDAGLSKAEEIDLRNWLEADPRHAKAFERTAAAWSALDRPFAAGAAEELLTAINVRTARRRRRVASAIAALAIIGLSVSAWRLGQQPAKVGSLSPAVAATNAVMVVPRQQTLPDGSVVELKDGAEIAVNFTPALRRVTLLRGEGHFQVTKDATRPFIVTANGIEARAVGTAFSVLLARDSVQVFVTEGHVAVDGAKKTSQTKTDGTSSNSDTPGMQKSPSADATVVRPVLGPGQLAVISFGGTAPEVTSVAEAESEERMAWRAPRVEFTRAPLSDVVRILNEHATAHHNVHYVIEDPSLNNLVVTGLFRVDNTDAFTGLLRDGFSIDTEYRGKTEIILRRAR